MRHYSLQLAIAWGAGSASAQYDTVGCLSPPPPVSPTCPTPLPPGVPACRPAAGAFELDGGMLSGRTLLNLDTEDWGDVFIGCAGAAGAGRCRCWAGVAAAEKWQRVPPSMLTPLRLLHLLFANAALRCYCSHQASHSHRAHPATAYDRLPALHIALPLAASQAAATAC